MIVLAAWAVFEITHASDGDYDMSATADVQPYAVSDPMTAPPQQPSGDPSRPGHIVISKQEMTLSLYDQDDLLICRFPIACGRNLGNKSRVGDMKTPEGDFTVQQIQPASTWTHDFGDGKGEIKGCYGNWFIRLKTPPHTGIGIHGTHDPASIGTRATEGCIRLHNADLDSLKPMVRTGMAVRIESSDADRAEDMRLAASAAPTGTTSASAASASAKTSDKGGGQREAPADAVWYDVVSGDTAFAIARRYGISLSRLKELNPDIENFDRLSLGQRLRVE